MKHQFFCCDLRRVSSSPETCSRAGNGAVSASAVVSQVARHAANSLGNTLTTLPLPNGSTNVEKELVTARKGRLVKIPVLGAAGDSRVEINQCW